jgi:hypothetical protein
MLKREKTRVRKNSCLTTRAPYKVVARTTLTTWQAPPLIVSSTLLGAAAKQRREAAVAMESTGRKKCMCEKFMLDKSAPYKGFFVVDGSAKSRRWWAAATPPSRRPGCRTKRGKLRSGFRSWDPRARCQSVHSMEEIARPSRGRLILCDTLDGEGPKLNELPVSAPSNGRVVDLIALA